MTGNPWIELSNEKPGIFQLAGEPKSNYNLLLYGKALLARREGCTIFFIDNHGMIDLKKLRNDFNNDEQLLGGFYLFSPKNLVELLIIIDDLELFYFSSNSKPCIYITSIFEFLVKQPTNTKNLGLMAYSLGLLRDFEIPVFVTNEMRSTLEIKVPFLSFFIPQFFTKVFIVEIKGKQNEILQYVF